MMSNIDRTIERLESELRVLDRQNAWLEAMLENMEVGIPATRRRLSRSPIRYRESLGTALDRIEARVGMALDRSEAQDDFFPSDTDSQLEESTVELVDEYQDIDEDDDTASIGTVVYHTEMWGFHPAGVDRGSHWWDGYTEDDDSDDETIIGEWEDPLMTPMKRHAPVASTYYNDMSPGF